MNNVPKKLFYSRTHEWIRKDQKDQEEIITVGITDHAQCMLGDLVYIELPEIDSSFEDGQECAVVESVKAAADIYCPIPGEIIEINEELLENPQLINQDPYGKGWLFRIRPFDKNFTKLLTADQYSKQVASEAH